MTCKHQGLRTVSSSYDHERALMVFYWTCERCGARLHEASRAAYRPQFDPHGTKPIVRDVR